jgi:lipid-binding SYLF domain-containing protein
MTMIKRTAAALAMLLVASTAYAALTKDEVKLLNESASLLSEIRQAPDKGIPEQIWSKAECVLVFPSLKKAGFIVGGEFGSGVMSCRHDNAWSAPVFMSLTKGSAGFQIGAEAIQLVLVVMNEKGADKLLGDKVTLGADTSIAAGPVGRAATAATDAQLTAEMLAYSRAKGLFAGVDLSGGSLRPDDDKNHAAYGANVKAREIVSGTSPVTVPVEARSFSRALGSEVRATSGKK